MLWCWHESERRSHHVNAVLVEAHGSFVMLLTSYPPEGWRRFVIQQEEVANTVGVIPNSMHKEVQQPLFELVKKVRASTQFDQGAKQ